MKSLKIKFSLCLLFIDIFAFSISLSCFQNPSVPLEKPLEECLVQFHQKAPNLT